MKCRNAACQDDEPLYHEGPEASLREAYGLQNWETLASRFLVPPRALLADV